MNKTSKLGFSLIELSIVILVIGILIIGITQGSRIISEARLKSARSLTTNSPINSIPNLILWLETTSEKSFDSSAVNNTTIANWYDISNRVNVPPTNATQNTPNNQPTYVSNAVNGLPAINFNGSTSFMNFNGTSLNKGAYTVFLVEQRNTANAGFIFGVDGGGRGSGFAIGYASSTIFRDYHYWGAFSWVERTIPAYTSPKTMISSISFGYAGNNNICIYINGVTTGCGGNGVPGYTTAFKIGRADFASYSGYIAEVIAFDRALKDSERKAIENYLSQKWAVKVS